MSTLNVIFHEVAIDGFAKGRGVCFVIDIEKLLADLWWLHS